ncbi:hypothetical protein M0802_005072 [Mischocyttarus mexicanus]|nr:hypothetical protein M0802_005072 [Mischocyttarus mexicanus]
MSASSTQSVQSVTMISKSKTSDRNFIIEDNILKAKDRIISINYTNIGQLLLDRMKAKPDFIGQIDVITKETYTFAKMYDYTVKCALWLRRQGIKRNDIIALCTPIIMDSFAPFFATFCVGGILTFWNSAMDIRETRNCMKLTDVKIVFAAKNSVGTILEAAKLENCDIKIVVFGESSNVLSFSKILDDNNKFDVNNFECTPIDDVHDSAAVLYSSGTTGPPKAVLISHFSFIYNASSPNGLNPEGIPLWFSQYFWITGVFLMISSITRYCVKLLGITFEEKTACKIIEEYKVTWIFMSPSMVNRILRSGYFKKYDVSSIKKMNVSGNVFTEKSQHQLQECIPNADIIQMFGTTELAGIVTSTKPYYTAGSIGTVVNNAEVKIIDLESRITLGPNKTGELLIKSFTVMKGYYNNPRATSDTIDADGWLHTGDLAYYNDNGEIFIMGRIKETIKYRGIQISPCEIESLLLTHPEVVDVAVLGVPHLEDDEHPIAFITKVPDSKVTERELQEFVARNMTDRYHLRAGIKFIENMPYTASGKISKKDLKAIVNSLTDTPKSNVSPRSPRLWKHRSLEKNLDDNDNKKKKEIKEEFFLTVSEAVESIETFDGYNMCPLLFLKSCQEAYSSIHPLDIQGFTIHVRPKIIGEADKMLNKTDLNYEDMILDIVRIFAPEKILCLLKDTVYLKRKLYESPIKYGKRLQKVILFSREVLYSSMNKSDAVREADKLEVAIVKLYINNIENEDLMKELFSANQIRTMIGVVNLAEIAWSLFNSKYIYLLHNFIINDYKDCLFCGMKKLHFYECPFKYNWQVNYCERKSKQIWDVHLNNIQEIITLEWKSRPGENNYDYMTLCCSCEIMSTADHNAKSCFRKGSSFRTAASVLMRFAYGMLSKFQVSIIYVFTGESKKHRGLNPISSILKPSEKIIL